MDVYDLCRRQMLIETLPYNPNSAILLLYVLNVAEIPTFPAVSPIESGSLYRCCDPL